jgi:hypothetical protein
VFAAAPPAVVDPVVDPVVEPVVEPVVVPDPPVGDAPPVCPLAPLPVPVADVPVLAPVALPVPVVEPPVDDDELLLLELPLPDEDPVSVDVFAVVSVWVVDVVPVCVVV